MEKKKNSFGTQFLKNAIFTELPGPQKTQNYN